MARLIDADALIQTYCCGCANKEFCAEESCKYYRFMRRIETAPTVEVEPVRHGQWVYDETIGGMKYYYCTSCKECDPGNECLADENQILWFAFCPKCGAKMQNGGIADEAC